ncbi:hypothetical protein Tco_1240239, partial [Tanacetum coccineum]
MDASVLHVTLESKDLDSNKGVRIDGNSNLSGIIGKELNIKSQAAGLRIARRKQRKLMWKNYLVVKTGDSGSDGDSAAASGSVGKGNVNLIMLVMLVRQFTYYVYLSMGRIG